MSTDMIQESSGNVFADLGFVDPASHRLKAELVRKIDSILKARGLTQSAAACLIGIGQPDLSRLLQGRFRNMSAERLLRMLTRLDCEADISVQREGRSIGAAIHLEAAAA
jgi:predicted XRE-type DNA-binding protein